MPSTKEIIDRFEHAFQTHDPNDFANIIAEDCVLENTGPAPDGARYEGRDACVKFWTSVAANKSMRFDEENIDILGDRAIIRWRLVWGNSNAESVRGVNIMRVRDGKITEALGYVKA
jgi:ketosteroid isomerase-like protein